MGLGRSSPSQAPPPARPAPTLASPKLPCSGAQREQVATAGSVSAPQVSQRRGLVHAEDLEGRMGEQGSPLYLSCALVSKLGDSKEL